MAKMDRGLKRADAPHGPVNVEKKLYDDFRRWARYYGKGKYKIESFSFDVKTSEIGYLIRFTDQDTAFWAKMKFS